MKVRFETFTLDTMTRQLVGEQGPIHLKPKAFDLLSALIEHRPAVLSNLKLRRLVWSGVHVEGGNVAVVVSEIRSALRDNAKLSKFIRTVPRRGYAFCAMVRVLPETALRSQTSFQLRWRGGTSTISSGTHVLGRSITADIILDVPGVSRRHGQLTAAGDALVLEDLHSKNGCFVRNGAGAFDDGRIVEPVHLTDGSAFRLGSVEVEVSTVQDEPITVTDPRPLRRSGRGK